MPSNISVLFHLKMTAIHNSHIIRNWIILLYFNMKSIKIHLLHDKYICMVMMAIVLMWDLSLTHFLSLYRTKDILTISEVIWSTRSNEYYLPCCTFQVMCTCICLVVVICSKTVTYVTLRIRHIHGHIIFWSNHWSWPSSTIQFLY